MSPYFISATPINLQAFPSTQKTFCFHKELSSFGAGMSRFLPRKKGKEKYELKEPRGGGAGGGGGGGVGGGGGEDLDGSLPGGGAHHNATNYGSITSLLNNEVN
jgi:hypothetical protein